MNTKNLKEIYDNNKSIQILFNQLRDEKSDEIITKIADSLIDLHIKYVDKNYINLNNDLEKRNEFILVLKSMSKSVLFERLNFDIKYCTYNTISEYCKDIIEDAFNAEINFKKSKGFNDITLSEGERNSIKSGIISKVFMMLSRYAESSDIMLSFDIKRTQKGVAGTIYFMRDYKQYYIETDVIYASGEVQRFHARYIVRSTNAPYIDEQIYQSIVKKVTRIEKLYEYIINPNLTNEGGNIKSAKFMIKKYNEDIERLNNLIKNPSLYNKSEFYNITKIYKYGTDDFLCYGIDNPTTYVKMMVEVLGYDYEVALNYYEEIDKKYQQMRDEISDKYDSSKIRDGVQKYSDEDAKQWTLIPQMKMMELSHNVEGAIKVLFTDKNYKKVVKDYEKAIKRAEKEITKYEDKITKNETLIAEKVMEYASLVNE